MGILGWPWGCGPPWGSLGGCEGHGEGGGPLGTRVEGLRALEGLQLTVGS